MFFNFNTDKKIIQGIERMDKESYKYEGELYEEYANLVKDLAMYKFGISEEDGRELYNDTMVAVFAMIRTQRYEHKASLKTLIYQILKNKCVSFINKNQINTISLDNDDFQLMNQAAAAEYSTPENQAFILHYVKQLSAKCQAILLLRAYYGFTDEELVAYINLANRHAVGVTRNRCDQKLHELYLHSVK